MHDNGNNHTFTHDTCYHAFRTNHALHIPVCIMIAHCTYNSALHQYRSWIQHYTLHASLCIVHYPLCIIQYTHAPYISFMHHAFAICNIHCTHAFHLSLCIIHYALYSVHIDSHYNWHMSIMQYVVCIMHHAHHITQTVADDASCIARNHMQCVLCIRVMNDVWRWTVRA